MLVEQLLAEPLPLAFRAAVHTVNSSARHTIQEAIQSAAAEVKEKKYKERVKFLKLAYDELAKANVLFFDYRGAASTYDKIASNDACPSKSLPPSENESGVIFRTAMI